MKVPILIKDTHEVLYDKLMDEVVIRTLKPPLVVRVPFLEIFRARVGAGVGNTPTTKRKARKLNTRLRRRKVATDATVPTAGKVGS